MKPSKDTIKNEVKDLNLRSELVDFIKNTYDVADYNIQFVAATEDPDFKGVEEMSDIEWKEYHHQIFQSIKEVLEEELSNICEIDIL